MTRVAFVKLEKPEKARYCCLLAEKFFQEGRRVLVVVRDQEQGQQLDKFLWTWRKASFIPHRLVTGNGDLDPEPVLIAVTPPAAGRGEILIMAQPCCVDFIRGFDLVFDFAEIYDPQLQNESRRRFLHFREAGLDPFMYQ